MRAAVALSGGVDSLRAAVILKELGYDVFGIHMRIEPSSAGAEGESATRIESREQSLKALAERFGIPVIVTDLRRDFESLVIQPFMNAYRTGLTPNPCVVCNPRVKFGPLLEKALSLGAKRFAIGHYARVLPPEPGSNRFRLLRARDLSKDQSYFLFGLSQEQLASALFPLGDLTKAQVKSWADQSGLSAVIPEESQEICFIPSGDYHEFLGRRTGAAMGSPGPIVDMEGNRLGEHKGVFAYTVGQRRGLGIASDAPLYVVDIDASQNILRVGRERDLYRSKFTVSNVNWVSVPQPSSPLECLVRIRNRHEPALAGIVLLTDTDVSVNFVEPQRAVTPGQAAVFYEDDLVLGGGIIQK